MGIEIHLTAPLDPDTLALLRQLLGLPATDMPPWANAFLTTILERIAFMSDAAAATIARLTAAVQQNTDVTQSAAALISGFHQILVDAVAAARAEGASPAMLQPFNDAIDQITQNDSALANAIAANTAAATEGA